MNELHGFEQSLRSNQLVFEVELSPEAFAGLSAYYSLLLRWNPRLHLVAPCSPEEFATRHVLESLMLLKRATMIESSPKKSVFLKEALNTIGRNAVIIARPFEQVETPGVSFVSCRALDQFMEKVPAIIQWAPPGSSLLLLGGETLREKLNETGIRNQELRVPLSEKRSLFVVA
jgi:16S rRNA G527 N7-methylase RsmG